jgi:hypothetical protein
MRGVWNPVSGLGVARRLAMGLLSSLTASLNWREVNERTSLEDPCVGAGRIEDPVHGDVDR